MRRTSHKQSPDPIGCFIDHLQSLFVLSFQATDPVPQGQGIVLAQTFDIPHLKAHVAQRFGDKVVVQFAGVRLVASRYIGHVNVTCVRMIFLQQLHHVVLFNLGMVDVKQDFDVWAVHLLNQPHRVFDDVDGVTGVVNFGVEDFQRAGDFQEISLSLTGLFSRYDFQAASPITTGMRPSIPVTRGMESCCIDSMKAFISAR